MRSGSSESTETCKEPCKHSREDTIPENLKVNIWCEHLYSSSLPELSEAAD